MKDDELIPAETAAFLVKIGIPVEIKHTVWSQWYRTDSAGMFYKGDFTNPNMSFRRCKTS